MEYETRKGNAVFFMKTGEGMAKMSLFCRV